MKLSVLLFLILLAMCCLLAVVLLTPEVEQGHGYAHPTFAQSMQHGGSGLERHARLRWLGLVFGLLQIVFFVACLVLGLRRSGRNVWPYCIGGLCYAAVFCLMVVADAFYVRDSDPSLVFGFPMPTFLMLFGLGGVPFVFVIFYVLNFDRWILSSDDLERFQESLQDRQQPKRDR